MRWRYQDVSSDESKTVTFVTATYLMTKKSQRLNRCWLADIGDHMCWWQVWDVDDRFNTLRKSHNILYIMKKVAKILIRPTTSDISHHHNDVTKITVTFCVELTSTETWTVGAFWIVIFVMNIGPLGGGVGVLGFGISFEQLISTSNESTIAKYCFGCFTPCN